MARLRVDAPRPSPTCPRDSGGGSKSQSSSGDNIALRECDVLNTTFSLHRASPLFLGTDGLSEIRLQILEQRLRDILTGDVVRGIEVGLDEGGDRTMGNAGALEAVAIEWVSAQNAVATPKPTLQVTLQYENALCLAVLLPLPEASGAAKTTTNSTTNITTNDAFLHLPLLLLRMPGPLKDIIVGFLSNTFDCRIAPLHLSSKDMIRSWESWAHATLLPTSGPLARDAVLTLAFSLSGSGQIAGGTTEDSPTKDSSTSPSSAGAAASNSTNLGLKTVDIFVPNNDLGGFLEAGQQLGLGLSLGLSDDTETGSTPFTSALAHYVKSHLGLDMAHPAVGVLRIACGGFVLSNSRLKIFDPLGSSSDVSLRRHRGIIPRIFGDLTLRASG